jgi:hypothetical protein
MAHSLDDAVIELLGPSEFKITLATGQAFHCERAAGGWSIGNAFVSSATVDKWEVLRRVLNLIDKGGLK